MSIFRGQNQFTYCFFSSFVTTSVGLQVAPPSACFFSFRSRDFITISYLSFRSSSKIFTILFSCLPHRFFSILYPCLLLSSGVLVDVHFFPQFWSPSQSSSSWVQQLTCFLAFLSSSPFPTHSSGHSVHTDTDHTFPFWLLPRFCLCSPLDLRSLLSPPLFGPMYLSTVFSALFRVILPRVFIVLSLTALFARCLAEWCSDDMFFLLYTLWSQRTSSTTPSPLFYFLTALFLCVAYSPRCLNLSNYYTLSTCVFRVFAML